MPAYAAMKRRERLANAPIPVPRALFMRGDGWAHAQRDVLPRSPTLVLVTIAFATVATSVLMAYALLFGAAVVREWQQRVTWK